MAIPPRDNPTEAPPTVRPPHPIPPGAPMSADERKTLPPPPPIPRMYRSPFRAILATIFLLVMLSCVAFVGGLIVSLAWHGAIIGWDLGAHFMRTLQ